jgi:hypothetical protein
MMNKYKSMMWASHVTYVEEIQKYVQKFFRKSWRERPFVNPTRRRRRDKNNNIDHK